MILGLFGPGGFGREVMVMLQRRLWNAGDGARFADIVFVATEPRQPEIDGVRVVSERAFADTAFTHFAVAIADATTRAHAASRLAGMGKTPLTVISDKASVSPHAMIGDGAIFCDFSMVTANAVIGRHFHCNIYSYVAHDCRIGDFVTFAPAVRCNGNVHVGHGAYLGTGCAIRQGSPAAPMTIGEKAIVGMGAVVTKPVAAATTVAGNPARPLQTRPR